MKPIVKMDHLIKKSNCLRTQSGSDPLHSLFDWHSLVASPSRVKPEAHMYCTTDPTVVVMRVRDPFVGVPGSRHPAPENMMVLGKL